MEKIVLFGAGGHASVAVDLIEKAKKYAIRAVVTAKPSGSHWLGYPVITEAEFFEAPGDFSRAGFVAIGDNFVRETAVKRIEEKVSGFRWVSLVHPATTIARDVLIGDGTIVMAGSVLQINTHIGRHCIVNTSASLDHDCVVEDFASVAPGAVLGGRVRVERASAIGLGASVHQGVTIGPNAVVGGGSLVARNVPASVTAYGVPCKVIRARKPGEAYLK